MTKAQLCTLLMDIGLREPEAQTYLEALSLGPTTVLQLAKQTNIKRTTLYTIVEELQRRGLMSTEVRGLKQKLVAAEPQRLEFILNQQREKLARALPDLEALYNFTGEASALRYYKGLTAMKGVYESLIHDIRPNEEYSIVSDLDRWLKQDEDHFMDFIRRRAKLNIRIRLLLQDSPVARQHKRLERTYHEAIKILPKETKLTTNLVITPQRVLVHQIIPPNFGIVIENKSIIQMHREQFEIMWSALE